MGLAGEFVQVARTHPRGERLMGANAGTGLRLGFRGGSLLKEVITRHVLKVSGDRRVAQMFLVPCSPRWIAWIEASSSNIQAPEKLQVPIIKPCARNRSW